MLKVLVLGILLARPNWERLDFHLYLNRDTVRVEKNIRVFEYSYYEKTEIATVNCDTWLFNTVRISPETIEDLLAQAVCK